MGPPSRLQAGRRRRGRARCPLELLTHVRRGAGAARVSVRGSNRGWSRRFGVALVCASKRPNSMNTLTEKPATVYSGLDISKAELHLHLHSQQHLFPNTAAGHRQLLKRLRTVPGAHVVCEATGGYERAIVAALQAAEIPVSVLNPALVRHFALAQGQRAKNDPLDAAVLTAYGVALRPQP